MVSKTIKLNSYIKNKQGLIEISLAIMIAIMLISIPLTKWFLSLNKNNIDEDKMNMQAIANAMWVKNSAEDFNDQTSRISSLPKDSAGLYSESEKLQNKYKITTSYSDLGKMNKGACDTTQHGTDNYNSCRRVYIKVEKLDKNGNVEASSKPYTFITTRLASNNMNMLPIRAIVMYSGDLSNIPSDWQLCDGTNGTPDLRDKFLVGAGCEYPLNATGGQESVLLSPREQASHYHYYGTNNYNNQGVFAKDSGVPSTAYAYPTGFLGLQDWRGNNNGGGVSGLGGAVNLVTSLSINNQAEKAHENRPPYYAVYYIMKVK